MKNKLKYWLLASACLAFMGCSSSSIKEEEQQPTEEVIDFYKGADISWVTELESKGQKFYNSQGQERECTALMKEYGMNGQ